MKCILETFGQKNAFFTVGGNASKSGLMDALFDVQPKYLLIDEIEHLKPEFQTTLLSLMETGILTQTMHSKVRQMHLKTWVFATSNGTKKLSEPLLSRFRVMHLNEYDFSQFYEIAVKKLLAEGLDNKPAHEIAISVWEQLPSWGTQISFHFPGTLSAMLVHRFVNHVAYCQVLLKIRINV